MVRWKYMLVIFYIINFISLGYGALGEWEEPTLLLSKDASQPSLTFNRENIFIAYSKKIVDNSEIFLLCSTNDGRTWNKERRLTTAEMSSDHPVILFANNTLFLFWVDFRNGNNDIYFTYSSDPEGNEFQKEVQLVANESDSIYPYVCTSGDYIFLFWTDDKTGEYELYSKRYDLYSLKWSDEVQITKYSGGSFYPSAYALLDEVHLCWQQRDGDHWKIMYSKSDEGTTWSKPITISEGLINAYTPSVSATSEGIKAIFQGYKDLESDIYLSTYNSLDEQWGLPSRITMDLNIERYPKMINASSELDIFWTSLDGQKNSLFFAKSFDQGITVEDIMNLSLGKEDCKNYNVIYNSVNNNIYVVWEQGIEGALYFTRKNRMCPAPTITSSSHKEDEWSIRKEVRFKWEIKPGNADIKDFAYIMDQMPDSIPEIFLKEYPVMEANFYNVKDGIWYFHLRARDQMNNISETVHYKVMINSELYASKEEYYVVKYKDTLWDISNLYFKDPELYPRLAEYNSIDDPNLIFPHQIIKIPPQEYMKKK